MLAIGKPFIAAYIERSLKDAGAQVLGPVRTLEEAMTLVGRLRGGVAGAVISASFSDQSSRDLLAALAERLIPCLSISEDVVASGTDLGMLRAPFAGFQVVDDLAVLIGGEGTSTP